MSRLIAAGLAACALALVAHAPVAMAQTKIKMVLNWKYQGPQAWFFIAQDKGYFKAEGLDVEMDQGEGSAASIIKVANGSYNVGFGDTLANPEAGMDTVLNREPLVKRDIEKERLIATIKEEMSSPEIAKIGLGDVTDERLEKTINVVVEANGLTRKPSKEEVFSRAFLPPRADRLSKLTITGK